jgi:protein involved in polysaccharide export with SLBB domain
MRGILFIAGLLMVAVVGFGCDGTLSRNKEAVASEPVFADLPPSTSAPDNPEVNLETIRPGNVIAINFRTVPAPIEVNGAVEAPGKLPFTTGMTVLKAIESAGGFTEGASQRRVRLIRADGRQLLVNCIEARREAQLDVPVFPNDRIIVPGRLLYRE